MKISGFLRKGGSTLALAVAVVLVIIPGSLVYADDEQTYLDIQILNMDFKLENTSLKDELLVLPVGMELNFMNVDPLITSTGLEGLVPHFLFINDPDGKEVARSKIMNKADQANFHYKFDRAGTYTYGCIIHFFMRGKIQVFDVQPGSRVSSQRSHGEPTANGESPGKEGLLAGK